MAGMPLCTIHASSAADPECPCMTKFSHTDPHLCSFHWLSVAAYVKFRTLMLAYKAKNGPAPAYLKTLITPYTTARSLGSFSTA